MEQFIVLILIIVLALAFDFINGFHDAANSIATVVSTRVLTPFQGVLWAAFFNFVAFFIAKFIIGEFGVADTVAKTVAEGYATQYVVLAGIVAAITWNLITWWFGIPSSSSHTLIGGFAGAAIAASGFAAIHSHTIILIASFIVVAPLIGMVGGIMITALTLHIAKNVKPHKADKWFKQLQLFSSALLSIGHGLNDSQKEIGIIATALIAYNIDMAALGESVPHWLQLSNMKDIHDWVPFACFTSIACGTMAGGYKVMKTMGSKITKITPVEGFCAQTAGAFTLFLTQLFKVPVSTTHVISGSIMGVGATKRLSAVRWGITINLLWAWILTIPVSALLGGGVYLLINLFR